MLKFGFWVKGQVRRSPTSLRRNRTASSRPAIHSPALLHPPEITRKLHMCGAWTGGGSVQVPSGVLGTHRPHPHRPMPRASAGAPTRGSLSLSGPTRTKQNPGWILVRRRAHLLPSRAFARDIFSHRLRRVSVTNQLCSFPNK